MLFNASSYSNCDYTQKFYTAITIFLTAALVLWYTYYQLTQTWTVNPYWLYFYSLVCNATDPKNYLYLVLNIFL